MKKFKILKKLETLANRLGLAWTKFADYFGKRQFVDITKVEPGMFWYEDDSFSFDRVTDKKIKAIVELFEDGIIYGDLTASELQDIKEQSLTWSVTKVFIDKFSYPCQKDEKIVLYNIEQLDKVHSTYNLVKEAFCKIGKPFRDDFYWSSTEDSSMFAWRMSFYTGVRWRHSKYCYSYVRPVLAKVIF